MRYIWAVIWAFLLMQMLTYVAGAMLGVTFDPMTGTILGIVSVILILVISAVLPEEASEDHTAH